MNKCLNNFNDVKHLLNKDSIIFDIGFNVGDFSYHICKSGNYSKIYCFEPVKKYLDIGRKKLQKYKKHRIF